MATFSTGEVARVAGVPVGTLNVWINRGLLPEISAPETSRGKARVFSIANAINLSIVAVLVRLNQPITSAVKVLAELESLDKISAATVLIREGGAIQVSTQPALDALASSDDESVLVVRVGKIVDRVTQQLQTIEKAPFRRVRDA